MPTKVRVGVGSPETGVTDGGAAMWVLGTDSRSSAKATDTLDC